MPHVDLATMRIRTINGNEVLDCEELDEQIMFESFHASHSLHGLLCIGGVNFSREQVTSLIGHLQAWVATGSLKITDAKPVEM